MANTTLKWYKLPDGGVLATTGTITTGESISEEDYSAIIRLVKESQKDEGVMNDIDPIEQNRQDINELYLMVADMIGGAV